MRVPLPQNEPQRVAAVESYGILDTPPEVCYDELTELAARICQTPAAYIKFFDDTSANFKSKVGLPPDLTEMPREATLCNWTLYQADLVVIADCAADERTRNHQTVLSWPKVRFYCSIPLIDSQGYALGTFCVFDYEPHEMTFEQQEAIRALAHQAVSQLELRRTSSRLHRSLVELERAKEDAEEERAKADALLCDILPQQVAEELKSSGHVQAQYYQLATILFTDFHGFTSFATKMEPALLVETLGQYFSGFDEIIEQHRLEKIKTIGDSYMCAGGVPVASRTHTVDACLAALDMRAYTAELNHERASVQLDPWEMRIGVHAGPVMTGVVGRRKFTYDLWGDTVNLAQRMEAAGAPGRINISESVYHRVRHLFEIELRGMIAVRGKGELPMYFLDRIKPELSADPEGRVPNPRFATERLRA